MTAPTSSTIAPTARSMLPKRMTKEAPRQATRSVLAWPEMAVALRKVRNASLAIEKKTTSAATTAMGSQMLSRMPRMMLARDSSASFPPVRDHLVAHGEGRRALIVRLTLIS